MNLRILIFSFILHCTQEAKTILFKNNKRCLKYFLKIVKVLYTFFQILFKDNDGKCVCANTKKCFYQQYNV